MHSQAFPKHPKQQLYIIFAISQGKRKGWSWFFLADNCQKWYCHFWCVWPDMSKLPKTKNLLFFCNISRKKWMMSFNFGMKINIKVFYMLILSFWVCITRNAQSTQIKFACLCSIFRKAWAMKLIFYLQINTYTSPNYQKQKVCYFSAIS